eukprot:jgi/Ulvmu1/4251/UM192_0011.1
MLSPSALSYAAKASRCASSTRTGFLQPPLPQSAPLQSAAQRPKAALGTSLPRTPSQATGRMQRNLTSSHSTAAAICSALHSAEADVLVIHHEPQDCAAPRGGTTFATPPSPEPATRQPPSRGHLSFSPAMNMNMQSGSQAALPLSRSQSRGRRPSTAALRRMHGLRAMRAASHVRRPGTAVSEGAGTVELRRKQHSHLTRYRRAMMHALHADDLLEQLGLSKSPLAGGVSGGGGLASASEPPPPSQHSWKSAQVEAELEAAREELAAAALEERLHAPGAETAPDAAERAAGGMDAETAARAGRFPSMLAEGHAAGSLRSVLHERAAAAQAVSTDALKEVWSADRADGESRSAALLRSLRALLRENTELMHAVCLPASRKKSRRLQGDKAPAGDSLARTAIPGVEPAHAPSCTHDMSSPPATEAIAPLWPQGIGVLEATASGHTVRAAKWLKGEPAITDEDETELFGLEHRESSSDGSPPAPLALAAQHHADAAHHAGVAAALPRPAVSPQDIGQECGSVRNPACMRGGTQATARASTVKGSESSAGRGSVCTPPQHGRPSSVQARAKNSDAAVARTLGGDTENCSSTPVPGLRMLLGVLGDMTQREREAARPPPLPLPPAEVAAEATLQWRLQRVWLLTYMPALQRLEMLVQFTEWGFAERAERVVGTWEAAVAAVQGREAALAALAEVTQEAEKAAPSVALLQSCTGRAQQLLLATEWVHVAKEALQQEAGVPLTFRGQQYPPAGALGKAALAEMCDQMMAQSMKAAAEKLA